MSSSKELRLGAPEILNDFMPLIGCQRIDGFFSCEALVNIFESFDILVAKVDTLFGSIGFEYAFLG